MYGPLNLVSDIFLVNNLLIDYKKTLTYGGGFLFNIF
jgi:hypothetical protein